MISVVGAGPAGSYAAEHAAKKHETLLYESQTPSQRRVQCAGLISVSGLERLGIGVSGKDFVLNAVRGARVYSPGGNLFEIDGGRKKAYVLDRRGFDNSLMEKAADAGAKIITQRIDSGNIGDILKQSERLILATGTDYKLHRSLGIKAPKEFLIGAQYDLKLDCDPDYVEMYLDVPGFFSWVIPAGDYARVGLCTKKDPLKYLDLLTNRLRREGRLKDERILGKSFGTIPYYDPKLKTDFGQTALAGDAAGHVKATTGGGVIMGCLAAKHACEKDYERTWRKEIGRELQLHLLSRRFLDSLTPKNTDRLINLLSEKRKVVEEQGDMDRASPLIKALAKDPLFAIKLLPMLPDLI